MSEADKDGRIAEWLRVQHAILGMEIGESTRTRTEEFERILNEAAEKAGMTHRQHPGGQCDYAHGTDGSPRPNRCPDIACPDCGGEDDRTCACWISLEGMALADIKALLAEGGLSVGLPEAPEVTP